MLQLMKIKFCNPCLFQRRQPLQKSRLPSLMLQFGPVWSPMVSYDPVWFRMVPYSPVWSCLVLYGSVWYHMVPCNPIWSLMVSYGPVCSCRVQYLPIWLESTRKYSTRSLKTVINTQLCILLTKQHLYKFMFKIISKGPQEPPQTFKFFLRAIQWAQKNIKTAVARSLFIRSIWCIK